MAAKPDVFSEFQQLLECAVCLMKYSMPAKVPKILRCGHTFCVSCLDTLMTGGQICCPTCHTDTDAPSGGAMDLTSNHPLVGMIENICPACDDHFKQERCPHCQKNLCMTCIQKHTLTLKEDTKQSLNNLSESLSSMNADTQMKIDELILESSLVKEELFTKFAVERTQFKEEQKHAEQNFLAAHNVKFQQSLEEFEESQKEKMVKLFKDEQMKCELSVRWSDKISELSKQINGENLSVGDLLAITHEVSKLQEATKHVKQHLDDAQHFGKVHVEEKSVGKGNIDAKGVEQGNSGAKGEKRNSEAEVDPSQSEKTLSFPYLLLSTQMVKLNRYRRLNQPRYIIHSISRSDTDKGYMNVTLSPKDNTLFVADYGDQCIINLSDVGQQLKPIGGNRFHIGAETPRGVAIDTDGNVTVACGSQVVSFSEDGSLLWRKYKGSNTGYFQMPCSVALGDKGNIYVADANNHRIQVRNADGDWRVHSVFTVPVRSVAYHPSGAVVVGTHGETPQLWRVDPDGSKSRIHLANLESLNSQGFCQICVDEDGYLLIADASRHCILVVDISGHVHHKIGEEGALPGQFLEPAGVSLTRDGRLVVAEYGCRRIQIF